MPLSNIRSAYKGQLTTVEKDVVEYETNASKLESLSARYHLEGLRDSCERIRTRYTEVQYNILKETPAERQEDEIDELNAFLTHIEEVEERINSLITKVLVTEEERGHLFSSTIIEDDRVSKLLEGFNTILERMNKNASETNRSYTKLEPVQIPPFSGSYIEWHPFKDLFVSMVDKNPRLTKTQKFHHLKSKLTGQAKGVIDHLPTSEDSYDLAWEAIQERYDSKKNVVKSHLERFKS
uniref:Uncharacterized protein n=1 Tax=Phlebotomus papatasi TaxID=29031 RepID=A0A1B0DGA6_PHLPP